MKLLLFLHRGRYHPSYRPLCCEYSSGTVPHVQPEGYEEVIPTWLQRASFTLRKKKKKLEQRDGSPESSKRTRTVPVLRAGGFARVFCFIHLRCIKDGDTRAIRGYMRNAVKRIPLQYHGRPRRWVHSCRQRLQKSDSFYERESKHKSVRLNKRHFANRLTRELSYLISQLNVAKKQQQQNNVQIVITLKMHVFSHSVDI